MRAPACCCASPEPVLALLKAAEGGAELHVRGEHELMEEPELESSEVWPFCSGRCKSVAWTSLKPAPPLSPCTAAEAERQSDRAAKGVAAAALTALFQEDQEAADIVVTEARCAGGDEAADAAARSAPAEEAGMDTDAPKGGHALGGGPLVIKAAGALDPRWAALFCIAGQFLLM